MPTQVINFGEVTQGAYRDIQFTFKQGVTTPGTGTPTNPSGGAFVNMTLAGGSRINRTADLVHVSAGVYKLPFSALSPGHWTGTAFAPPGSGQAAQPFEIVVIADPNYSYPPS